MRVGINGKDKYRNTAENTYLILKENYFGNAAEIGFRTEYLFVLVSINLNNSLNSSNKPHESPLSYQISHNIANVINNQFNLT